MFAISLLRSGVDLIRAICGCEGQVTAAVVTVLVSWLVRTRLARLTSSLGTATTARAHPQSHE
jgi:hypothetical protein